jgi:hypothetical protein
MAVTKKLRFEVLKRDSFRCQYCGASAPEVLLQVDHIKPVAGGGSDDIWNLVTSCQPCNSGKSDRTLSDQATITKAKKQLDALQERREQLEMLMEWQASLADLDQHVLDSVVAFCEERVKRQNILTASGREYIAKLIKKYGVEDVLKGVSESANRHLEVTNSGQFTDESVTTYYERIGAFCEVNRRSKDNPVLKQLFYIRGILRKRLEGRYYDHLRVMELLEAAESWGVSIETLTAVTKQAVSWKSWSGEIYDLISEAKDNA